jgi:hypothetical protein
MWEDPIVAEIHRTREKHAAAFNFDIDAIFADLRKRQGTLSGRPVQKQPRKDETIRTEPKRDVPPTVATPGETVAVINSPVLNRN